MNMGIRLVYQHDANGLFLDLPNSGNCENIQSKDNDLGFAAAQIVDASYLGVVRRPAKLVRRVDIAKADRKVWKDLGNPSSSSGRVGSELPR